MSSSSILQLDKSLVLVGLMGCGKSAVGRRLARKTGVDFVDLDKEIERLEGMSIVDIFSKKGELYFREKEQEVLSNLFESKEPCILATGGGAFINEQSQKLIKEKAISVWIKADLEILLVRVAKKNTRPLLEKGDKRQILKELMDERYPIYEQADYTVISDERPHEAVMQQIMDVIK